MKKRTIEMREHTYVFTKLGVVAVLDFVKVIFVELANERGKVGVFEETREDGFREFVHVLCCKVRG
jgi:hypothetical protein